MTTTQLRYGRVLKYVPQKSEKILTRDYIKQALKEATLTQKPRNGYGETIDRMLEHEEEIGGL